MAGKKKGLGQISDAAGDSVRRLVTGAPGGMMQGRYENLIKWAQSNGDGALVAKLTSGQITPDELHQVNMAYFSGKAPKPMADAPARQMELDLPEDPGTGMVPYGARGPGVPVGGPSGPGVAGDLSGPGVRGGQMIPSRNQPPAVANRGMIDPSNPSRSPGAGGRRGTTTSSDALYDAHGRSLPEDPGSPGWPAGTGSWAATGRAPDELGQWHYEFGIPRIGDGVLRGDTTSPARGRQYRGSGAGGRPVNAPRGRSALTAAAGAGLGGIGVYSMMDGEPDALRASGDLTDTSGTEALAEESRPVPATVEGPPDYSFQARELINKLNAMRRKAGGEVPEAKAMMAEINRLLDLSNKQKNAPGYEPPTPTDYHGEAQRLIQKLNAMNQEIGGMSPETPKIMAEVRRLQALGDQQRNAR